MFKNKLGEDSPIPKMIPLKIRRRGGNISLTTLEEGEFKVPTEDCISKQNQIKTKFHVKKFCYNPSIYSFLLKFSGP